MNRNKRNLSRIRRCRSGGGLEVLRGRSKRQLCFDLAVNVPAQWAK